MEYSGKGLELTKREEGLRLMPYQDQAGVWTDGYGNTHNVTPGVSITEAESVADLRRNINSAVRCVNQLVKVKLNQNQFDALVDFVYNVGSGNFSSSTLLKLLNAGDYEGASQQFQKWLLAGGKVSNGLKKRRNDEMNEFNGSGNEGT